MIILRVFTDEEFYQMICEVDCDNPKYVTLCKIADKVLKPTAIKWCTGGILKGRYTPEDLMNDIHVKLIQKISTGFLRNERFGGDINKDPDGFNSWLFEVAHNLIFDKTKKTKNKQGKDVKYEAADNEVHYLDEDFDEEEEIRQQALSKAFNIVLNSDRKVYITLTWIAQSLFVIQYDLKRSEATEEIIKEFQSKSLFDMWKIILAFSKQIPWLMVTPAQRQRISTALCTPLKDDILLGEVKYEELFMSKGPKQTISDWVNRIDNMIKGRMRYEPFDNN